MGVSKMSSDYVGKICPYCKSKILEDDSIVLCSKCNMPHHKECWVENQGCTTFGCDGTIQSVFENSEDDFEIEIYDDSHEPVLSASEKNSFMHRFCSKCGAKLVLKASFCTKCGNRVL